MKFRICAFAGFVFLILFPFAGALEKSVIFQSIGYGRGWSAYTCLVDYGTKPTQRIPGGIPTCETSDFIIEMYTPPTGYPFLFDKNKKTRDNNLACPFEESALAGFACSPDSKVPAVTGVIVEINVPEDIKLVTKDGFVLSKVTTEACEQDEVSVQEGAGNGEWWYKGGIADSPPIYWVGDVEKFVSDVMKYQKETISKLDDIVTTENFRNGYVDKMFGIPIYSGIRTDSKKRPSELNDSNLETSLLSPLANIAGNLVCSLRRAGNGNTILKAGDTADVEYDVLCSFYYFAGETALPAIKKYNYSAVSAVLRHPTILQTKSGRVTTIHDIEYNTTHDLFKIGTVKLNKKLKVVAPTKVKLAVQTQPSQVSYEGKNVVKLVITNTQSGVAQIDDVDVGAGNKIIFCDKRAIGAGESAECLASVGGAEPVVKVSYSETSCGKEFENLYVSSAGGFEAGSCETDFDCKAGVCCAGLCRANGEGTCEDIDGNGVAETWVPN